MSKISNETNLGTPTKNLNLIYVIVFHKNIIFQLQILISNHKEAGFFNLIIQQIIHFYIKYIIMSQPKIYEELPDYFDHSFLNV